MQRALWVTPYSKESDTRRRARTTWGLSTLAWTSKLGTTTWNCETCSMETKLSVSLISKLISLKLLKDSAYLTDNLNQPIKYRRLRSITTYLFFYLFFFFLSFFSLRFWFYLNRVDSECFYCVNILESKYKLLKWRYVVIWHSWLTQIYYYYFYLINFLINKFFSFSILQKKKQQLPKGFTKDSRQFYV